MMTKKMMFHIPFRIVEIADVDGNVSVFQKTLRRLEKAFLNEAASVGRIGHGNA